MASYEATEFGVHSGMPITRAFRFCPEGVFLCPRFKRYRELSDRIFGILWEIGPDVDLYLSTRLLSIWPAKSGSTATR